jgi:thiamine-phosphate pyrophosphorylase
MTRELPGGVYGITSTAYGLTHTECAKILLEAGVRIIQYREKNASTRKMYGDACAIKTLCERHGAVFIVNDRLDIALAVGAHGVHLGQDDLPLAEARRLFPEGIIGVSAHTLDQALEAEAGGADYLGVGSVYPTNTKGDAHLIGEDGLARIVGGVRIPVYAIGGIGVHNIRALKALGVKGVAVVSGILADGNPAAAAKRFVDGWSAT